MKKNYLTKSSSQTKNLGEIFSKRLVKEKIPGHPRDQALIIGLEGDLGGGKTTFLQGFARGLKIKEKILSPSFIILRKFQVPNYKLQTNSKFQISKFQIFYHIDCYRIEKPKELLDLGFKEIISNPQNIVAVEWAEKIKKILPKKILWINFEFIDKTTRKLIIKEKGA